MCPYISLCVYVTMWAWNGVNVSIYLSLCVYVTMWAWNGVNVSVCAYVFTLTPLPLSFLLRVGLTAYKDLLD